MIDEIFEALYRMVGTLATELECMDTYIDLLEKDDKVFNGCADCMREKVAYCDKAVWLKKVKSKTVVSNSFGDGDNKKFPTICVKEWIGNNSLYCPICKEIIPAGAEEHNEKEQKVCPFCDNELEEY